MRKESLCQFLNQPTVSAQASIANPCIDTKDPLSAFRVDSLIERHGFRGGMAGFDAIRTIQVNEMDLTPVDLKPTITVPKELDLPQESFPMTIPKHLSESTPVQTPMLDRKPKVMSNEQLINQPKKPPASRQGPNSKRK